MEQVATKSSRPAKRDTVRRVYYHNPMFKSADMIDQGRIVTIAYDYDRINKKVTYGHAIYNINDPKDPSPKPFNKKAHRLTAQARLEKKPQILENVEDDSDLKSFHEKIRRLIHETRTTYKRGNVHVVSN